MENDGKLIEKQDHSPSEITSRYRVTPRYGMWYRDGKWILEAAVPGVIRENVKIKVKDDFFHMTAIREDVEYKLDLNFNFQIEKSKTKAEYKEGLLKVEFIQHDPLADAYMVPIE